jgi:choline kinase
MKTLLIPSAALIPLEMRKKLGEIPAILFPLDGIPLLDHLYRQYKEIVDKIYLVVYKKKELIINYVQTKELNIEIVELDRLQDLGYTILCGLDKIIKQPENEGVYINFADTLIYDSLDMLSEDSCFYVNGAFNEVWTFFQLDDKNRIVKLYDKQVMTQESVTKDFPFFVGCFYLKNVDVFYNCLIKSDHDKCSDTDSFYTALQEYSGLQHLLFPFAQKWFDVGHKENYLKAQTGVQSRSFNTIEIDESRGILKKTSLNKEKFINEINWYLKLPSKLQYLTPRIYKYSTSMIKPYVEMECYGYNTLHELFLYGKLPLYKWQNIFEKLLFIIKDMSRFTVDSPAASTEAMRDIYITKTLSRLESIKSSQDFLIFFDNPIMINGKNYHSLSYYIEILPQIIEEELLNSSDKKFNIIHGDLCFSNILLEENHGFMRIIDPRGEFGAFDIYGDPRYEMAKLLHSIEGKYDFIIEDMFKLEKDGTSLSFIIPQKTDDLLKVFCDVFSTELQAYSKIRLIESLLFLSMIPLHSDNILRQYAMLATGIMLLENVLEEKNDAGK